MYWSFLLTLIGCTGLYFAGKKKWWSWGINLASQVIWLTYSIATEQWGFIIGCFVYGYVYQRNLRLWMFQTLGYTYGLSLEAYESLRIDNYIRDRVYIGGLWTPVIKEKDRFGRLA